MTDQADPFQTLLTTPTEFQARAIVAMLGEAGIDAVTFRGDQLGAGLPVGQFSAVPVQVRQSELARARQALQESRARGRDLDWDQVELGEREDDLPLSPPGRMPLAAKIAFAAAAVVAGITVLLVLIALYH